MSTKNQRAMQLVQELIKLDPKVYGKSLRPKFVKIGRQFQLLPMTKVLAKVPGSKVADKCRRIGVSRTSYYYWRSGYCRPNHKQAKRLSQLTGFSVSSIRPAPPR